MTSIKKIAKEVLRDYPNLDKESVEKTIASLVMRGYIDPKDILY